MKRYIFATGVIVICVVFFGIDAKNIQAAKPLILVTWEAQSSAPKWFEGKALPIEDTKVIFSVEAIGAGNLNKGKLIDLSNREIRWYIEDDLIKKGIGMKTFSEINKNISGIPLSGKVSFDYTDPDTQSREFVSQYFSIPVVRPEVVIDIKRVSDVVYLNEKIEAEGIPFFFNGPTQGLVGTWRINEQQRSFDASTPKIAITIGENIPNNQIQIRLLIENPKNRIEKASAVTFFKAL